MSPSSSHSYLTASWAAERTSMVRDIEDGAAQPPVTNFSNPRRLYMAPKSKTPGELDVLRANQWDQNLPAVEVSQTLTADPFIAPTSQTFAYQQALPASHSTSTSAASPIEFTDLSHLDSTLAEKPANVLRDGGEKPPAPQQKAASSRKPSMCLLFAQLTRRDVLLLLMPGLILSLITGCLPPLMAKLIGKAFDAFTAFNVAKLPISAVPQSEKDDFMSTVLTTVYLLIGLAAGTMAAGTSQISVWICIGEQVASRLRNHVYAVVASKKMEWFDLGMGLEQDENDDDEAQAGEEVEASLGAGGLMAKFARETDDVRIAASRVSGELVQHITTAVASLILALYSSWNLTLVILTSIPMVIIVSVVCEVLGNPLLQEERKSTAQASGIVERVIIAINTVKAFNAEKKEEQRFSQHLERGSVAYRKISIVWSARFGITSTIALSMFVQGFWYGSHLVQKGKMPVGTVLTVFMSCLLVSNMLQQIVQSLNILEKGKIGAANMAKLADAGASASSTRPLSDSSAKDKSDDGHDKYHSGTETVESLAMTPLSQQEEKFTQKLPYVPAKVARLRVVRTVPLSIEEIPNSPSYGSGYSSSPRSHLLVPKLRYNKSTHVQAMRKIRPNGCQGEFVLRNVSFAYPSRPDTSVLQNVDMYFPASETTYVVGGSGSGKSTIAHLLLRIYEPTQGDIELDDQKLRFLDPDWCKEHIAAVSQTPIVFDLNVHDNVALGLVGSPSWKRKQAVQSNEAGNIPQLSREDVRAACRVALLHDFIRDLPDGYNTQLGQKGASLSGGQKQRLAIARARVRDPEVLILDEATSALDPTSRLLVHEAVKHWRRGKTTIVITHDLTQIGQDDFIYLLEQGRVAEHGYRADLEQDSKGRFRGMLDLQQQQHNQSDDYATMTSPTSPTGLEQTADRVMTSIKQSHTSFVTSDRRRSKNRLSAFPFVRFRESRAEVNELLSLTKNKAEAQNSKLRPLRLPERQEEQAYLEDASRLESAGLTASSRRTGNVGSQRRQWDEKDLERLGRGLEQVTVVSQKELDKQDLQSREEPTFKRVTAIVWATIPSRAVLVFGISCCVVAGTITPIFSYMLAQLLSTMGRPGQSAQVLHYSLVVLLLAFLEGIIAFVRFSVMELLADKWVRGMRNSAYRNILRQDRTYFDKPESSAGNICTSIVKDAEDARNLIGIVVGQLALVLAMISVGLIWALVVGWELTLVGMAFAPVFIVCMMLQSRIVDKYEGRNKVKREQVGKRFYDMVSNMRGIRAMSLEPVFEKNFTDAVVDAQRCGMRAAAVSGFGHGLGEALTYLAEALMFAIGALLMTKGLYDFNRMTTVFNLIIFAVSFAAQIMSFLPSMSKAMRAVIDLNRLLQLSEETLETGGEARPTIEGELRFADVGFSYALRPDVPVLGETSFTIAPGECVAIVGGSGCGKSTTAALTQRLYEPISGAILLDGRPLSSIDTKWLREHISIVSQHPNLFDMTVAENIAYGANSKVYDQAPAIDDTTMEQIKEAARAANVDEFIQRLPKGYATPVGESAALISGGQAQRIAIARALMRNRAKLLILDECTSALDVDNQEVVVKTLMESETRKRVTTLVVTHKVDLMKRCDRILVLQDGRIVQQGSFDQLMAQRGGAFASLARGGEWSG